MKNSTLTFIGRDSGFGNRNNSAYYETKDKLILIDCGFTVFNEIKDKFNFNNYRDINIIITHLHNDHAGSLSQMILYLWFIYHKKVTVVSKCNRIRDYLDITGTPRDGYELKDNIENVKFIKTEHSPCLDSYGFEIILDNKRIIYTGDSSTMEPFMPYIKHANELYIDVSRNGGVHIKLEDVIGLLERIQDNGTNVFLMHLDDKKYIKNVTENKFSIE